MTEDMELDARLLERKLEVSLLLDQIGRQIDQLEASLGKDEL